MIYDFADGQIRDALLSEATAALDSIDLAAAEKNQFRVQAFLSLCMWSELLSMAERGLLIEDDRETFNEQTVACLELGQRHFFKNPIRVLINDQVQPTVAGSAYGLVRTLHGVDYFDSVASFSLVYGILQRALNAIDDANNTLANRPSASPANILAATLSMWSSQARAVFDVSPSNRAIGVALWHIGQDSRLKFEEGENHGPER